MKTIEQVKKQYSKLTDRERFALIVAAAARDDQATRKELMASAPRKTWSVPHTWGISHGFMALTDYYLINQLGAASTIWLMSYWQQDEGEHTYVDGESGERYTLREAHALAVRRFVTNVDAFKAICEEYKVSPADFQAMTEYHIYDMVLLLTEVTARRFVDGLGMELPELEETKRAYRMLIEKHIKDWE